MAIISKSIVGFICDKSFHYMANQAKENYWYTYIREISAQLGVSLSEVSPSDAEDINTLSQYKALFVGGNVDRSLSSSAMAALNKWIADGGILIGFSPTKLDSIFGVEEREYISQLPDDYTISGYFSILEDGIGRGIHSEICPEQNLMILSDIRLISPINAKPVGCLFRTQSKSNEKNTSEAAITERTLGKGIAYYFCFDVPKTIWLLHQGRPVWKDLDGDNWLRTADMTLIGKNCCEVLYADELKFLIQKMIAHNPIPFIHHIPPIDDKPADSFFYWGGDDEGDTGEVQVKASNFMHSVGLPYQINCMPVNGGFPMTDKDIERIRDNGHMLCIHYDFVNDFPHCSGYSQEDVDAQMDLFRERFGSTSISGVNHCVRWWGWTEPARWMMESGQLADNSWINSGYPPSNPKNVLSFAFGTAFPFYFYEDFNRRNQRLDFVELPQNAYELGRSDDETQLDIDSTKKSVDIAARYEIPLCAFYHPVYLANSRNARRAVENTLDYIENKQLTIKHMTTSDAALWWRYRDESSISNFRQMDDGFAFSVETAYPEGLIVKLPIGAFHIMDVKWESEQLYYEKRIMFGMNWVYIVVPKGKTEVFIKGEYR